MSLYDSHSIWCISFLPPVSTNEIIVQLSFDRVKKLHGKWFLLSCGFWWNCTRESGCLLKTDFKDMYVLISGSLFRFVCEVLKCQGFLLALDLRGNSFFSCNFDYQKLFGVRYMHHWRFCLMNIHNCASVIFFFDPISQYLAWQHLLTRLIWKLHFECEHLTLIKALTAIWATSELGGTFATRGSYVHMSSFTGPKKVEQQPWWWWWWHHSEAMPRQTHVRARIISHKPLPASKALLQPPVLLVLIYFDVFNVETLTVWLLITAFFLFFSLNILVSIWIPLILSKQDWNSYFTWLFLQMQICRTQTVSHINLLFLVPTSNISTSF